MDGITYNVLIAVGGIVFTVVGGWYAMKSRLATLAVELEDSKDNTENALGQIKALWEQKDASVGEVSELKHKTSYMARDIDELRDEAKYQRRKSDV